MIANTTHRCHTHKYDAQDTSGVIGANYDRFIFGLIFLISVFYNVLKFPYESLIRASGNFRTARKLSVIELLINLVLTISLVSL